MRHQRSTKPVWVCSAVGNIYAPVALVTGRKLVISRRCHYTLSYIIPWLYHNFMLLQNFQGSTNPKLSARTSNKHGCHFDIFSAMQ